MVLFHGLEVMIYFYGINHKYDAKRTVVSGGNRRYLEAVRCLGRNGKQVTSYHMLIMVGLRRDSAFVCFDERYLLLMLPLLLVNRKVFFFPRGNKLVHYSHKYSRLRLYVYKQVFAFLYSLCHKLVFQTQAQYREFKDIYGYDGDYSVLPNNIRASWMLDLFRLDEKMFSNGEILQIGFLGGRAPRKGFELLYDSLVPLLEKKQVNLIVCGGISEEFEDFDVLSLGHIDDLASFYARCHVIVIPSKYDSFPNVFLESLASSRIPLLFRDSITKDICGENSKILFRRDVQSIRSMIEKFINDERVRSELRSECNRLKLRYDFNWCREIKKVLCVE